MKLMPLLIVLLPIFVGCLMIYQGIAQSTLARSAKHWPKTFGTVVSQHVDVRQRAERRGKLPVRMKSVRAVAVEYEYRVDDQVFRNTQLIPLGNSCADAILAGHTPGDGVEVYFSPREFSTSFIERPSPQNGNLGILCGVALIAVAGWLAFRTQFA